MSWAFFLCSVHYSCWCYSFASKCIWRVRLIRGTQIHTHTHTRRAPKHYQRYCRDSIVQIDSHQNNRIERKHQRTCRTWTTHTYTIAPAHIRVPLQQYKQQDSKRMKKKSHIQMIRSQERILQNKIDGTTYIHGIWIYKYQQYEIQAFFVLRKFDLNFKLYNSRIELHVA